MVENITEQSVVLIDVDAWRHVASNVQRRLCAGEGIFLDDRSKRPIDQRLREGSACRRLSPQGEYRRPKEFGHGPRTVSDMS